MTGVNTTAPAENIKEQPDSDAETNSAEPRARVQAKAGKAAALRPPLRAVFMGTPEFAAIILRQLLDCPHVELTAVYTQPDRPAGRGKKLASPPVKLLAMQHALPVRQPLNFKATPEGEAAVGELAALDPDVLLVAAYGLILPTRVLAIPRLMPINVHASLLPKYRGAAPIQRAIMNGESVTGITIMHMEAGLDSGPILMQRAVGIDINDTSADLHDELAHTGAELLEFSLERLRAGALGEIPQDHSRASHAAKLSKEDSLLDISLPPRELHAHIRGVTPWPGAAMVLHRDGQQPLTVHPEPGVFPLTGTMLQAADSFSRPQGDAGFAPRAHVIGVIDDALLLSCGEQGAYAFNRLRPSGRKTMDGRAFFNGYISGHSGVFFTGRG